MEKVTLGILEFPPHSRIDEVTNECLGGFISITEQILAEYDLAVDVICAPPIRIYRMLNNGEVDFTINIKSTEALPKDVIFVETPLSTLKLELYSNNSIKSMRSIAAIRGFGYHGFRTTLIEQGYDFIDLPTSISAIKLFLKERSSHLISYRSPVDYYIKEKQLNINSDTSTKLLTTVPTYYAISAQSLHNKKLKSAFDDYASKHSLLFFDQVIPEKVIK